MRFQWHRLAGLLMSVTASLSLARCVDAPPEYSGNPTLTHSTTPPAWPSYSWKLPKTVLSVTATYTLKDCAAQQRPDGSYVYRPDTDVKVVITPSGVPDNYLGPELPRGLIVENAKDLVSFWSDTSITVETDKNHVLTHLASSPKSQVSTIVSSALSGVLNIAALGMGVPAAKIGGNAQVEKNAPPLCVDVAAVKAKIQSLKDKAQPLNPDSTQAKALAAQIQAATNLLSITVTCDDIDPGYTQTELTGVKGDCPKTADNPGPGVDASSPIPRNGLIALVRLTAEDMVNKGWVPKGEVSTSDPHNLNLTGQVVGIFLDFPHAFPEQIASCPDENGCERHRIYSGKDTLFREPAFIPVYSVNAVAADYSKSLIPAGPSFDPPTGEAKSEPRKSVIVPFPQFGLPRSVALVAHAFQNTTWDLMFAQTGEVQTAKFTSAAVGTQIGSLFSNATQAATAYAAEQRSIASGEAAALKSQSDSLNSTINILQQCAKYGTQYPDQLKPYCDQVNGATPSQ